MSEPTVRQIGRASGGRGPSTPESFCLEEVPMPATRRSQFSGRRSCESRVPVKCVDVDIGDSHNPQGESGLARHGSRRQRRPLHRFRCTRPDSLWHSPFSCRAEATPPTELSTEAAVNLDPDGQGFRITRSALSLRANVPNLDQATFARMAGEAEKNCPVSKVLNAEITLDAKLV
jgi:hypothetical protein